MLEEQLLIAPKRSCNFADHRDSTDEVPSRAAQLVDGVLVGEHLEEDCTWSYHRELVSEVLLPRLRPIVDIVRLELQYKRPAWFQLLSAVFAE